MSQNEEEIKPAAIIDWNDLSEADQEKAMSLLKELNLIFDKYSNKKEDDAKQ